MNNFNEMHNAEARECDRVSEIAAMLADAAKKASEIAAKQAKLHSQAADSDDFCEEAEELGEQLDDQLVNIMNLAKQIRPY